MSVFNFAILFSTVQFMCFYTKVCQSVATTILVFSILRRREYCFACVCADHVNLAPSVTTFILVSPPCTVAHAARARLHYFPPLLPSPSQLSARRRRHLGFHCPSASTTSLSLKLEVSRAMLQGSRLSVWMAPKGRTKSSTNEAVICRHGNEGIDVRVGRP